MKKKVIWLMLVSICTVYFIEPAAVVFATEAKTDQSTQEVPLSEKTSEESIAESDKSASSKSSTKADSQQNTAPSSETGAAENEVVTKNKTEITENASNKSILTVTFINGTTLFKQITTAADGKVAYPGEPDPSAGQISFIGWFTDPVGGSQFDFSGAVKKSMTLYARFTKTYLIQYKDNAGKVIDSMEAAPGMPVPKTSIEVTAPKGEHFSYWYVEGDSAETPFNFDAAKASKNIVLVPKFTSERTLLFISEGSQVDPQYVTDGEKGVQPTAPTREGYTFSHWSLEPDGKDSYNFTDPIIEDTTLYAVWTPEQVTYTIAYWMEKPNLSGNPGTNIGDYDFAWSTVKQDVKAGETISIDQASADAIKDSSPAGKAALKYSEYSFSNKKEISGNGQTVINVYYTRIVYQVTFDLVNINAEMAAGGDIYHGSDSKKYTISAKFGQNIKEAWPSNPVIPGATSNNFLGWRYPSDSTQSSNTTTGNPVTLSESLISTTPGKRNLVLQAAYLSSPQENVRKMYIESLDKTDIEFEGKYYDLFDTQIYYSNGNYIEDPIYGYTFEKRVLTDRYHGSYYYKRNLHSLTYNLQGGSFNGQEESLTLKYAQKIVEPAAPVREGYIFSGWYFDAEYRQKVDFSKFEMPDSDSMFFAKWESNKNIVRYFDSLNGTQLFEQGYDDNETIVYPSEYVKGQTFVEGKGIFNGWYWQVGQSSFEFSDTIPVTRDIDLFAKWRTEGFQLQYKVGEGSGQAPVDEKTYDLATKALIKQGTEITPPAEKIFIGWQSNVNPTVYYPEDHMQVKGDTTLTAVFASAEDIVKVNYHAGDYEEAPATVVQEAVKNSNISLKGSIFSRAGKTLIGWSKAKDGAKDYELGQSEVPIGNSNIDLYAVWEDTKVTVTFLSGDNGTLNYPDGSISTAIDYGTAWKDAGIKIPEPVADSGYVFAGWSPQLPTVEMKMTSDQVYTAQFTKKASSMVTVRYVNQSGEKIAEDKQVTGLIGDSYDVSTNEYNLKKIGDYKLVAEPDNFKGIFTEDNILVIYTYEKELPVDSGLVQVKYVDVTGKSIHPTESIEGKIGGSYDVAGSNFLIEGYHFVTTVGNVRGVFNRDPIVVTHVYGKNEPNMGQVVISYVDEQGKALRENLTLHDTIGKRFSVENYIYEIEGFQFDHVVGDLNGEYTKSGQTRKIVYKKIEKKTDTEAKKNNENQQAKHAKKYPKTGEQKASALMLSGILLVGLAGIIFVKRTRKE